jgi:hypothetical protein
MRVIRFLAPTAAIAAAVGILAADYAQREVSRAPEATRFATTCNLPPPEFAHSAPRGAVIGEPPRSLAREPVQFVAADNSVTIVGVCLSSFSLPRSTPDLVSDTARFHIGGGTLERRGSQIETFYLYPPTTASTASLVEHGRVVARVRIPHTMVPAASCPVSSIRVFKIVACGALLVGRLHMTVSDASGSITGVDGHILDGKRDMGFYLHRILQSRRQITLIFGFRPPSHARFRVVINQLFSHGVGLNKQPQTYDVRMVTRPVGFEPFHSSIRPDSFAVRAARVIDLAATPNSGVIYERRTSR